MAQFARPTSDVAVGDWGDSPLWSKLDGASPDDGEFITAADDAPCEIALGPLSEPGGGTVYIRVRYRKQAEAADASLRVDLMDGATLVATRTLPVTSEVFATTTIELSGEERASISGWSNLRVRLSNLPFGDILFGGKTVIFNAKPLTYAAPA